MKILITGTGKGLGSGLALHYLEKEHTVYGISRQRNKKLENYKEFHFLAQDLSEFEEMKESIPDFLKETKELDLAVLNAGILPEIKDLKDCSLEDIKRVMDINVWSNKILIDLLFENLEKITQIAAVSSGASVYGSRGWNSYSISKAALNMLIKIYSKEHENTHFCSIAPGLIDTNMQDYIYSRPDDPRFESLYKLKEAKRTGEMPTIDEAARTLAKSLEISLSEESGSFLDVREMSGGN